MDTKNNYLSLNKKYNDELNSIKQLSSSIDFAKQKNREGLLTVDAIRAVSYTHLTLPTNREV